MNQVLFLILLSLFHISCSDIEFDIFDPKKAEHESKIDIELSEALIEEEKMEMKEPLNEASHEALNPHDNQAIELTTPRLEEPDSLENLEIENKDKTSAQVRRAPSFSHENIKKEENLEITEVKIPKKEVNIKEASHSLDLDLQENKKQTEDETEVFFQEIVSEEDLSPIEQASIPKQEVKREIKTVHKKDLEPKEKIIIEEKKDVTPEIEEVIVEKKQNEGLDMIEEQKEFFSEVEESFIQESFKDPIDIVFVLDKSYSMENERKKLRKKMSEFFNSLDGMDWRLSIISSDSISDKGSFIPFSNGKTYMSPKTTDYKLKFFEFLDDFVSFNGVKSFFTSSIERPIEAAMMAVNQKVNKSFFRQDAKLVFVVLTNENENGKKDQKDFLYTMKQRFSDEKEIFVYSFIILPDDFSCLKKQHSKLMNERTSDLPKDKFGKKLYELSLQTGKSYNICSKDYGDFLKDLVIKSTHVRQRHFKLNYPVLEDKQVEVIIQPIQNDLEWRLEKDLIIFNKAPKAGSIIKVKYYISDSLEK